MRERMIKAVSALFLIILCIGYVCAGTHLEPEHTVRLTDWEYRWSEQWTAGLTSVKDEQVNQSDWRAAAGLLTPPGRDGEREQVLWLRTVLPEGRWSEPAVLLQANQMFEVYADNTLIYKFGNWDGMKPGRYQGTPARLVDLPEQALGKTVYIRIYSDRSTAGLTNDVLLGNRADIILYLLELQADRLFFGGLYILLGLMSLYPYIKFRRPLVFSFSTFSLLFGLYTLSRTTIVYFVWDHPVFWMYTELGSLMLFASAVLAFVGQLIGNGWGAIMRRLWQLHAGCAAVLLPLSAAGWLNVPEMLSWYLYFLLASMVVGLLWIAHAAWKGNAEARLLLVGALTLSVTAAVDIVHHLLYTDASLRPLSYIGSLFFLGALIRILLRRLEVMQQRLRNADKLSGVAQLAAGVAHEIRNPITILSGFLQIMAKDESNSTWVRVMLPEVERINTIMGDFLVLAKPSEPKLGRHTVGGLLQEITPLFEAQAALRGIRLYVSYTDDPVILCDKNQLKQVFVNLLKNAMEAMTEPGKITISLDKAGARQIRIRFQDQGVGVEEHMLEKLGEPFLTTKEDGTGLGLMICRRVVDSHGGRLRFDSRPGVGMTVDVFLPTG